MCEDKCTYVTICAHTNAYAYSPETSLYDPNKKWLHVRGGQLYKSTYRGQKLPMINLGNKVITYHYLVIHDTSAHFMQQIHNSGIIITGVLFVSLREEGYSVSL